MPGLQNTLTIFGVTFSSTISCTLIFIAVGSSTNWLCFSMTSYQPTPESNQLNMPGPQKRYGAVQQPEK